MYKLDLQNNSIAVHFIGIGGISMSGIAELFLDKGFRVSGSDLHESAVTKRLESLGIKVYYSQVAENITPEIGLVVYTAAIHEDNPEFMRVKELGIPMLDRADCLGQIIKMQLRSQVLTERPPPPRCSPMCIWRQILTLPYQ